MRIVELFRQKFDDETGAEIVEWVLWVGGIAVLASTMYVVLEDALTDVATDIIAGMVGISGS